MPKPLWLYAINVIKSNVLQIKSVVNICEHFLHSFFLLYSHLNLMNFHIEFVPYLDNRVTITYHFCWNNQWTGKIIQKSVFYASAKEINGVNSDLLFKMHSIGYSGVQRNSKTTDQVSFNFKGITSNTCMQRTSAKL